MCNFNKHYRLRAMLDGELFPQVPGWSVCTASNAHSESSLDTLWVPPELKQKIHANTLESSCWLCTLHFWVHFVWWCNFLIRHDVTLRHLQQLQWSLIAENILPVWSINTKHQVLVSDAQMERAREQRQSYHCRVESSTIGSHKTWWDLCIRGSSFWTGNTVAVTIAVYVTH